MSASAGSANGWDATGAEPERRVARAESASGGSRPLVEGEPRPRPVLSSTRRWLLDFVVQFLLGLPETDRVRARACFERAGMIDWYDELIERL
jgi:hypothetical protein